MDGGDCQMKKYNDSKKTKFCYFLILFSKQQTNEPKTHPRRGRRHGSGRWLQQGKH